MSTQNPSIEQFVQDIVRQALADTHTCLPGKVTRYDKDLQQADVQPLLQRKFMDGQVTPLPPISNVPVVHPRAGGAIIHMPVEVDDIVVIVFAERSLDRWLASGGMTDPGDPRMHDLSDAYVIPGGYPFTRPVTGITGSGLEISGVGKDVLLGELGAATHPAARGDNVEARLSALESGLSQLVTDFSTFITLYTAHMHPTAAPGPPSPPVVPGVPPNPFVADTSVVESEKVKVD